MGLICNKISFHNAPKLAILSQKSIKFSGDIDPSPDSSPGREWAPPPHTPPLGAFGRLVPRARYDSSPTF